MADGLVCDGCGGTLLVNESVRYVVDMKVYAAYDPLEVTRSDLDADHRAEIARLVEVIRNRDPDELMDEVARCFRFDLCPPCHKRFLKAPLGLLDSGAASSEETSAAGESAE